MKIKNTKVFWGSLLAFALISGMNSCQEYKLRHESKITEPIKQSIEELNIDDVFTLKEEIEIDEKQEITKNLLQN